MSARPETRFLILFALFSAAFLALGALGLAGLAAVGRLPPPPFVATDCIDEKFAFLSRQPLQDVDLVAVGSSVTWRNLDFSAVDTRRMGVTRPINAAPCWLYVQQTRHYTRFLVDNMPKVKHVMTVFGMRDFENCRDRPDFFPETWLKLNLFHGVPAAPLYFVNFRPRPFAGMVLKIKEERQGGKRPIVMDPWGSGPFEDAPQSWVDIPQDPACLDALAGMKADLAARGLHWIVVLFPEMPMWRDRFDPDSRRDRAWRDRVTRVAAGPNVTVLDASEAGLTDVAFFTDPAHLNWPQAARFTRWIFDALASERVQVAKVH